jgi:pimeloyl-ACP methyl ester carboxylesterase
MNTIEKKVSAFIVKSPVEHKVLKQEGYSIHYYISGDSSNELIVFLHPAFADHRCFDKQIDHFSESFRVVTIDMLGHGLSAMEKAKDKIDSTVQHIVSIIQSEGYKKAHFAGVSMGALIAQYFGLLQPEKVQSMTVLGGYDINADNSEIVRAQRKEQLKWIVKALFSMNSFRWYVSRVSVSNTEDQSRYFEMARHFTLKSFAAMAGLGKVLQKRENISRNYPMQILCGDQDLDLARKMNRKWHESDPASFYSVIENAGHCANMDNPELFNRLLVEFLKQSKHG